MFCAKARGETPYLLPFSIRQNKPRRRDESRRGRLMELPGRPVKASSYLPMKTPPSVLVISRAESRKSSHYLPQKVSTQPKPAADLA
jgi:hypothetical protein